MMDEPAKEVMRITRTGIWVNPDMAVDDAAKAVLKSIDENIKFLVQRAVEDEREACAKVCDDLAETHEQMNQWGSYKTAESLAQAIRARSEK